MLRQTATSHRRVALLSAVISLSFVGFLFLSAPKAAAIADIGPDPEDFGRTAGDDFSYVVSSSNYDAIAIPRTTLLLYFRSQNGPTRKVTITDANLCSDPNNTDGNQRDRPGILNAEEGKPATTFYVRSTDLPTRTSVVKTSVVSSSNTCFEEKIELDFDTSILSKDPDTNLYRAELVVDIQGNLSQALNRFKIQIGVLGLVGYSANQDSKAFGIARDAPAPALPLPAPSQPSDYRDYSIPFGPPCGLTEGRTETIDLYDIDYGNPNIQPQDMITSVTEEPKDGSKPAERIEINIRSAPRSPGPDPNTWVIRGTSKTSVYIDFEMKPGYKYKLIMGNVHFVNVLQFALPYDSIYYQVDCGDPLTISCSGTIETIPGLPEPATPIDATGRITINGGVPAPIINNGKMTTTPLGGAATSIYANMTVPPPPYGTAFTKTVVLRSSTFQRTAGEYVVTWGFDYNGTAKTCEARMHVVTKPYFQVKGSDVMAGSGMAYGSSTPTPCSVSAPNTKAGVVSWNNRSTFNGAGSQFATFAMNHIQAFATKQTAPLGVPGPDLSFANRDVPGAPDKDGASVDSDTQRYGGLFGDAPCIGYWQDKPDSGLGFAGGSLTGLDSGTYVIASGGGLTINASTITKGKHLTFYVTGNVNITGDISFANSLTDLSTNWAATADIPSLKLIVNGNIYINPSVGRLDGLYAAIPNSAGDNTTGIIDTCSNGMASYAFSDDFSAACSARTLTFNGAVAANQLWLMRTRGSFTSNPIPAEIFNYTPEMWMASGNNAGFSNKYDAVIGLPPVL